MRPHPPSTSTTSSRVVTAAKALRPLQAAAAVCRRDWHCGTRHYTMHHPILSAEQQKRVVAVSAIAAWSLRGNQTDAGACSVQDAKLGSVDIHPSFTRPVVVVPPNSTTESSASDAAAMPLRSCGGQSTAPRLLAAPYVVVCCQTGLAHSARPAPPTRWTAKPGRQCGEQQHLATESWKHVGCFGGPGMRQ